MSSLIDIAYYICKNYPHKDELSKARLTKMVYLTDWKSCLIKDHQLTTIEWFFDNYGPFVDDIHNEIAKRTDLINITHTLNYYGSEKTLYSISQNEYLPTLDESDKIIIDEVIERTKSMHWDDFINFVYSTYPIATSQRYSKLNLREKAHEYKKNTK